MEPVLISPASFKLFGFIPTVLFSVLIPIVGVGLFTYIMAKRIAPLVKANPDFRFDRPKERVLNVLKIWLAQYRHPRYMMAGVLHIIIFFGFLILSVRSSELVIKGISADFIMPGLGGTLGDIYYFFKDYAATAVFFAVIIAAIRRGIFRPDRYIYPKSYGHDHTNEAVFVCLVIATLMVSESLFEACLVAAEVQKGLHATFLAPGTLAWLFKNILLDATPEKLQSLHILSYYVHDLTFFFFLCFLPMGKHFHVITSLFNVFFMRLDRGNVRPVRYGVSDEELDNLESFGVKKFSDFTWKDVLDFYTCADCGRCSDQCPANRVKRPLSPRFISIKGRDYAFSHFPLMGEFVAQEPLIGEGGIYSEDEIWSCTTCGACEQECPIGIEYINKIVDLRRGMVDSGNVPQSLQKPLSSLEKRGNPYGKMEKKRSEWTKGLEDCEVKLFENGDTADTLYFVDSVTSFDERMQNVARATAKIMCAAGIDFGILGKDEKDSGNEVKRFGEEMLFQNLKRENSEAILESGVKNIVTADPHAYNALKNEYTGMPPVNHISQIITKSVSEGRLKLKPVNEEDGKIYTYHDPCYLGRHNGIYEEPRAAIDAIPGIRRVEMMKSRDRSFCCSGGGLMLFYEPEEEERMGALRVKMAQKAGANVIVTACPFCLVNMEDAIKVAGMEGKMEAIDLGELVAAHIDN
ncbi:MAG: 4Fe-4S dicluster domain-containing protein [Desulfobacteraceae bacterium]|nr:MAG: 4Fe-4S dicluster domain-containing protein [Desulfobacteraceae bacterium]